MKNKTEKFFSEGNFDKLINNAWDKPVNPNSIKFWQRIDKSTTNSNYTIWKSIAAIFVIAFLTAISLTLFNINTTSKLVVVNNDGMTPKEILLEDGSKVFLNRNSGVTYSPENSRMLNLTGEAYFEIKKDKNHPFTVNTRELTLSVLGTSFNVNAYKNTNETIISLVSGKLKVSSVQNGEKILSPGEELIYNNRSKKVSVNSFNVNTVLAWRSSLIKCENTGLDFLLDRLENYYAIEINNKTDYANCKISGEFRSDLSLDEIMEIISFSHNIEFLSLKENEYKIKGEICE